METPPLSYNNTGEIIRLKGLTMSFENLDPAQKDRLKAAKSLEEMEEVAEEEGFELSDEQLDAIAGGRIDCPQDYCCSSYLNERGPFIL